MVQALTLKPDALFNLNWKFIQGNPSGSPQSTTFSDASWATVSIPHSASYDAPTVASELKFYGNPSNTAMTHYWYRKKFVCPASAQKVFIRFEGVMQGDTVYVNGTQVGTHYNSGYTGFFFDISNYVTKGDTTLIAVHCTINNDANIPPGGGAWTSNGGAAPDLLLFSGIYRNVHLIFKDSVYVPPRGQRITTTGSMASPTVRAITNVKNEFASAKSVTVALTLFNNSGVTVATQTATQTVSAAGIAPFDMTTPVISSPSLWSPTTPTLYSLQTLISVGGAVVDSSVQKIGLRFYSWSAGTPGGLLVNGTLTELRGVCHCQFMGWIENAVPDSRWAIEVATMKAMGINSIRCSHYPRADAFYAACDSVGMLVNVEVPSWGVNGGFSGLTTFWSRMYSCDSEMVLDGYNHPSIYSWGCFNEPSDKTLAANFSAESTIIHALDPVSGSGRVTLVDNYSGNVMYPLDIYGLNYNTTTATSLPTLNTEAYGNAMAMGNLNGDWFRVYLRGDTIDMDTAYKSEMHLEDSCMRTIYWLTNDKCGGGHFWCMQDYCSYRNQTGLEGIVDRLWIPKNVYSRFRLSLTGAKPDYWQKGTPTKLLLSADLTTLQANGSDISQIVATMRDSSGNCLQMPCNITLSVTGPATLFPDTCATGGSLTGNVASATTIMQGGRCGALLRTTTTPGPITVTATSSCGLSPASITLASNPDTESYYLSGATSVHRGGVPSSGRTLQLRAVNTGAGIRLSFPAGIEKSVRIIDLQGKVIAAYTLRNGIPVLISRMTVGEGVCYAAWSDGGRRMLTRLNLVQ
jgi:hypothetical protein